MYLYLKYHPSWQVVYSIVFLYLDRWDPFSAERSKLYILANFVFVGLK